MIAAFEFHDLVATGMRTGQPHRVHIGFTSGADKPDLLSAGNGIRDFLCQFDAAGVICKEGKTLCHLLGHNLNHFRVAVTHNHRTGTDQIINIFSAILVPDMSTMTFTNHNAGVKIAEPACR